MRKLVKIVIAAGLFSVSASMAIAAPASVGQLIGIANGVTDGLTQMHFRHRSCELGPLGWHRHTWNGYRVRCWPRARHPHRCFIDRWGYRHCAW